MNGSNRCFMVWRRDDDNLPVSQSLIRQLFTEITVKRSTSLTTLWIYLLPLRVDHHQSASLSPKMND